MITTASLTKSSKAVRFLAAVVAGLPLTFGSYASAQKAPQPIPTAPTSNPFRHVGLLTFFSDGVEYIGSGTVIRPSSILTAGHNLYARGTGWSTNVVFERSYYYGTSASRATASRMFLLGGYASQVKRKREESDAGFARDMGGVVFYSRPAGGKHANFKNGTKLLTGKSYNMSLGYGAIVHTGQEMLISSPTRPFHRVKKGYYENRSYGIEGGMSGGPVFARSGGKWFVSAVNVSGPGGNVFHRGAGVRAIDNDAAKFIKKNLR